MRLRDRLKRLGDRGSESGSGGGISLVFLIFALALLAVFGLVVDGGTKARALDQANQIAYEAARAGLQAMTPVSAQIDAVAVDAAAETYLTAHGATGTASVSGQQVSVDVTLTAPTKVLMIIGIDHWTVTGHGTAFLAYGQ